jgi:NADH dehydrogenase [ubiquinone] 1 alpha subcomplex assembly factor 2
MKVLAAQADARWAAKPSLLGADQQKEGPAPALGVGDTGVGGKEEMADKGHATIPREETWRRMQQKANQGEGKGQDPWKQQAPTRPSEQWQPKAWQPPRNS